MKIKITRVFRIQLDARKVKEYPPGVYDVGVDIDMDVADKMRKFGKAEVGVEPVVEKVAPENKVVETPENKARVAKKPGRRRSTRTKPDK